METGRRLFNYSKIFEEVLLLNSVNTDDFEKAKREWVVAGGHYEKQHKTEKYGRFSWEYYCMYFQNKFKAPYMRTDACICSHHIEQNCYIYNVYNKKFLVVGNCCAVRCLPNSKKTCEECNKTHKRHIKNVCVECEKSGNKCFKKGMYKGLKLIDVIKTKHSYVSWCLANSPSVFPSNTLNYVKTWIDKIKIYEEMQRKYEIAVNNMNKNDYDEDVFTREYEKHISKKHNKQINK